MSRRYPLLGACGLDVLPIPRRLDAGYCSTGRLISNLPAHSSATTRYIGIQFTPEKYTNLSPSFFSRTPVRARPPRVLSSPAPFILSIMGLLVGSLLHFLLGFFCWWWGVLLLRCGYRCAPSPALFLLLPPNLSGSINSESSGTTDFRYALFSRAGYLL